MGPDKNYTPLGPERAEENLMLGLFTKTEAFPGLCWGNGCDVKAPLPIRITVQHGEQLEAVTYCSYRCADQWMSHKARNYKFYSMTISP